MKIFDVLARYGELSYSEDLDGYAKQSVAATISLSKRGDLLGIDISSREEMLPKKANANNAVPLVAGNGAFTFATVTLEKDGTPGNPRLKHHAAFLRNLDAIDHPAARAVATFLRGEGSSYVTVGKKASERDVILAATRATGRAATKEISIPPTAMILFEVEGSPSWWLSREVASVHRAQQRAQQKYAEASTTHPQCAVCLGDHSPICRTWQKPVGCNQPVSFNVDSLYAYGKTQSRVASVCDPCSKKIVLGLSDVYENERISFGDLDLLFFPVSAKDRSEPGALKKLLLRAVDPRIAPRDRLAAVDEIKSFDRAMVALFRSIQGSGRSSFRRIEEVSCVDVAKRLLAWNFKFARCSILPPSDLGLEIIAAAKAKKGKKAESGGEEKALPIPNLAEELCRDGQDFSSKSLERKKNQVGISLTLLLGEPFFALSSLERWVREDPLSARTFSGCTRGPRGRTEGVEREVVERRRMFIEFNQEMFDMSTKKMPEVTPEIEMARLLGRAFAIARDNQERNVDPQRGIDQRLMALSTRPRELEKLIRRNATYRVNGHVVQSSEISDLFAKYSSFGVSPVRFSQSAAFELRIAHDGKMTEIRNRRIEASKAKKIKSETDGDSAVATK